MSLLFVCFVLFYWLFCSVVCYLDGWVTWVGWLLCLFVALLIDSLIDCVIVLVCVSLLVLTLVCDFARRFDFGLLMVICFVGLGCWFDLLWLVWFCCGGLNFGL